MKRDELKRALFLSQDVTELIDNVGMLRARIYLSLFKEIQDYKAKLSREDLNKLIIHYSR